MSLEAMPVHVALVDQSGQVDPGALQTLAGDLSQQITRDFCPIWKVKATVGAYTQQPRWTWAVVIQNQLDEPGALGYHTDNHFQPIAYVEYTADYSVTVSHETLEMLADPWGSRMHSALIPEGTTPDQFSLTNPNERVHYLLEVCDPCEANSYQVGQSALSDFLLPGWYYTAPTPGQTPAYSHNGYCTAPRQVADGGYVSFGTDSGEWWQVFNQGGQLSVQDIGRFDKSQFGSLREWADAKAREFRSKG